MHGEIFHEHFIANFPERALVKNVESQPVFTKPCQKLGGLISDIIMFAIIRLSMCPAVIETRPNR